MKAYPVSREEKVLLSVGGLAAVALLLHAALVDPRSRMNPDLLLDQPGAAVATAPAAVRPAATAPARTAGAEEAPAAAANAPRTFAAMERPHPLSLLTPVRLPDRRYPHP